MMPATQRSHSLHRVLALLLLGTFLAGFHGPVNAQPIGQADPPAAVGTPNGADAVIGNGPWEKAACMVCAGTILAAGGTSIFGLFVLSGIFPEAVLGCAAACMYAFAAPE